MTYKAEGDVLQADAILQKGYTYKIFMCNDTVSKTYLSKMLLSLDDIVMALFDTVEKNTINAQWIIYTTQPPFSRQITITRKIMPPGVMRKVMRGILS